MNEPNSEDNDGKWQKHGDIAILLHCKGVQLDSWVSGIDTAHDVVIAAWTRQDNDGDCSSVAPSRYVPRLPPGLETSWLLPDRSSPSPLACYSRTPDDEELSVEVIDPDRIQNTLHDSRRPPNDTNCSSGSRAPSVQLHPSDSRSAMCYARTLREPRKV